MPKYMGDFPDLKPILIPQICNKCQNILKVHCIDPINEINQIFTIVGQIKGIITKTVFLCTPKLSPPF